MRNAECVMQNAECRMRNIAQGELSANLGSPVLCEANCARTSAPLCKGSCQAFQFLRA